MKQAKLSEPCSVLHKLHGLHHKQNN